MKKNVLIVILAILVLGLGGYLIYDKVIVKDNNVKEENINKDFDLVEAKKLINKYTHYFMFWENMFKYGMTDDDKAYLAIVNTTPTKMDYDCKEAFPNMNEYDMVESGDFAGACYALIYNEVYNYNSVNETYHKLFGNDKDMPKKLLSVLTSRYAYVEKYGAYVELSCECGGAYTQMSYYGIDSAKQISDKLEIVVNYVEFDWNYSNIFHVETRTDIGIPLDDPHYATEEQMKALYERAIKELEEDEINKYKFTFKNSDTGYYLESITNDIY